MVVYLVNGNWLLTNTVQEFLGEVGHQVVPVWSPRELPGFIAAQPLAPCVVVADLQNSREESLAMLRDVHAARPDIPIIAVTSHGQVLPPRQALDHGIHSFLRTPVCLAELELTLIRLGERVAAPAPEDSRSAFSPAG